MPTVIPYVPQFITVHLGPPNSSAQNATVSFPDYIKNVASSEIYPTWDEDALRANILAQISFALNRVYTEFYRAQGKNFDITSSTAIDQKFILGRNIFSSVERIVDEIFNDYIRRIGFIEPLAAKFCNGTTVTCDGLSQWGSENLAQQGYGWLDILYRYYGYNIEIVVDAPIRDIRESYPGYALSEGSRGAYVQIIQTELNRISVDYPLIPKINPVDGVFGPQTRRAVETFQRIFNLTSDGIVGRATWYKLVALYTGILRFSELNSEGQRLFGFDLQFPYAQAARTAAADPAPAPSLSEGDSGQAVSIFQFLLAVVAEYNVMVPSLNITGQYGPDTTQSVAAFQEFYGLPATGNVDEATWNAVYDQYSSITQSEYGQWGSPSVSAPPFPGTPLAPGSRGENVVAIQQQLNLIYLTFRTVPPVQVTGVYGPETERSVRAYQEQYGLPVTGVVDADTWRSIANTYQNAVSVTLTYPTQFPGMTLRAGMQDAANAAQGNGGTGGQQ